LPTIAKSAQLLRSDELRPADLVAHCLARIEQFEADVHAWVLVDADGARREARRLGDLADSGEWLGPLHGIPIGIKDIIDVAGWPTRCGSPLRTGHVANQDAPVVARLRKAGAIILGKTVTTEWAGFDPPITRNPWDLAHTPGGSSSGSAAAVALEMCHAALGTQTGGSIIRPAAFCGVAGLKPGYGDISLDGIAPLTLHLDHVGPIARTVADLYAVWQPLAIGAHGSIDSLFTMKWARHDLEFWLDCYGANKTLFVLEGPLVDRASAEVREITGRAIDRLRSSVWVRPLALPDSFRDIVTWHRRVMAAEAAAYHRQTFPSQRDQYGPQISALLDEGRQVAAVDYAQALIERERVRSELAALLGANQDLLGCMVMPATLTPAPGLETTGDPAFNSPWSYLGLPSLTIPCGRAASGLPVGLQFIALTMPQVFAMAGLCERVLSFRDRPPLLEIV
ncbi:MAG: amidase, partial [Planctomycetaceae bacterium]|nr:amidase [Planctomycetaceae bacterium]